MSKKITTILTKIIEQLKDGVSKKEITKLNDYHNTTASKTVNVLGTEHTVLIKSVCDSILSVYTHDGWLKDIITSELNKIARAGKGTIKFNINTKEYEILKSWLKENIDE